MNSRYRPFLLLSLCVALPIAAALWLAPPQQHHRAEVVATPRDESAPERAEPVLDPRPAMAERDVERFFIWQGGTLEAACE
mgnify:CR=1 FL=1